MPKSGKPGGGPLLGQPIDQEIDVGLATYRDEDVQVRVFTGSSVLDPGAATDRVETIGTLLSPLAKNEVGTIRCIGMNVRMPKIPCKINCVLSFSMVVF